jgi:pimeloyl-ACP methyl ester carboxylesterase
MGKMTNIEPITGRYVRVSLEGRDYRTYFEENANRDGRPIVCLHTAGADSIEFRHLLADTEIAERYRVIAFDMPWHGRSLPPDGWWAEEYRLTRKFYVSFVVAFCEALGLEKPILMGCSMGGYVMFDIARDHPDRFSAFISLQGRDHEPAWDRMSKWFVHPEVNANTMIRPLIASLVPGTADDARRYEIEWIYARCGPGVLSGDFHFASADHDSRGYGPELSKIGEKLYLIAGDWDWSCFKEHTDRIQEAIKGITVVRSPDLGHFPMSEDPVAFRKALDPVLRKIEQRKP